MLASLSQTLVAVVSWSIFFTASLCTFAVGVPAQILALPFDPERRVSLCCSRWFWAVGHFFFQPFWRTQIDGSQHLGAGPYVFVANHISVLDIPLSMHLPVPLRVLTKAANLKVPIMGHYMALSRQIYVDASSREALTKSYASCQANLAQGVSLLVFAEGSRSTDGKLAPFKKGAFRMAKDAGCKVVPLAISGTSDMLPKGRFLPIRSLIHMRLQVLEPIDPAAYATSRKMARVAREQICTALGQPTTQRLSSVGGL
jgi:1-acyl-sn-glycerol-3-phosphate acyltransferase